VLQSVAVCCSVLQCVMCCSVLQCFVAPPPRAVAELLQSVAVCCSVLQCVAAPPPEAMRRSYYLQI